MASENIQNYLAAINPSLLNYEEWLMVGMAIKAEGLPVSVWDEWSQNDSRYDPRTIDEKWDSFQSQGVTGGSIAHLAKEYGYTKPKPRILDWNSVIRERPGMTIPSTPPRWNPTKELIEYLDTLYDDDDFVNIVLKAKYDEAKNKWKPGNMGITLKAKVLRDKLENSSSMEECFGDVNPEAGAWIRLNPTDGEGIGNKNTTKFRYALIESDEMPLDQQMRFFKESHLPIKLVVNSGGKSLHAVVDLGAKDKKEFDKRVLTLFNYCSSNGFEIDENNKNCSRLSRAPGFIRGENKQFIVSREIGCKTWEEFDKYRLLPAVPEALPLSWDIVEDNVEKPWIIEGLLAERTKMMIAAAPKSGKTMLCIQLALAFATGGLFLNKWRCRKLKVLYIDGELGRQTFVKRLKNVAFAMEVNGASEIFGEEPMIDYIDGVEEYDLMDMIDSIIEKYRSHNYGVVIIDPIYLLFKGDESNSEDARDFVKRLTKLKEGLGCSIVYVHHHSKGNQGEKSSMDRYSGSGVFARDADAIVDLSSINTETGDTIARVTAHRQCEALNQFGKDNLRNWANFDSDNPGEIGNHMRKHYGVTYETIDAILEDVANKPVKAFQIAGTVRHYADFNPFKVLYEYPLHVLDGEGLLAKSHVFGSDKDYQQRGADSSKEKRDNARDDRNDKLISLFHELEETHPGEVTKQMMFEEWNNRNLGHTTEHNFQDFWLKEVFNFVTNPNNKKQKFLRL